MSINVHTQPFSPKPSTLQIPEYTRSLQVNQTIKCICITFIHICSRSLVSHLDLHFPPRFLYIFISPLSPAYDVSNDYKVVKIESHTSKDKSSSVILLLLFRGFSRWENTESSHLILWNFVNELAAHEIWVRKWQVYGLGILCTQNK